MLNLAIELPCCLCGDLVHRAASPVTDSWIWVDREGRWDGTDADLRGFPDGPYARLAFLAAEIGRGQAQRKGKAEPTWLWWRHGQEYSALKVRLDMKGCFHQHRPDTSAEPPYEGTVPEHCGWPAWLRPSGWSCRRCGLALADPA